MKLKENLSLEKQKEIILTELYNSGQLQDKVYWALNRHRIPNQAGIQDDIIQEIFLNLSKFNTKELVEIYNDNPKRVLGLAVTIMSRKGLSHDKRSQYGYKSSPAAEIMHLSNIGTYTLANINNQDEHTTTSNHSISPFEKDDDKEFDIPDRNDPEDIEERENEMWSFVRNQLTPMEEETLDYALVLPPSKMRKQLKKDYYKLLPKLKTLITDFQNNY